MSPVKKPKPSLNKDTFRESCAATPRKSQKWREAAGREPQIQEPLRVAIFAIEDALVSGRAEDTRKYILWKLGERCRKLAEFSRFNQNVCDPPEYWAEVFKDVSAGTKKVDVDDLVPNMDNTRVEADNVHGADTSGSRVPERAGSGRSPFAPGSRQGERHGNTPPIYTKRTREGGVSWGKDV